MIYIVTGAIRSGKTTALFKWCNNRNDVDGLLCPDAKDGKRYFLKVKQKDRFTLEANNNDEDSIEIGHFKFLKSAFNEANTFLNSIASNKENKYIVIDEIGKLELKNEGLHLSADTLISKFKLDENQHVILVVRDYLFDAVMKHYTISDYYLLNKEDLESFF
ncbi:nucleoside-triphosphatase [Olleya sp. YS]|uniref:nucleoside-triphosphatase n=1 Tax=Olleya sp. YS TaxID=3028318 RepID=UPI002434396B|nr:nucleoside-triphosphatase [Olleya sp. YS]WGD33570.1 nucleoside-triphosphatase [Olleya sp. YS]